MRRRLTPLFMLLLGACSGELQEQETEQLGGAHSANPNAMNEAAPDAPAESTMTSDFEIDQSGYRLLPFDVRVRKLESASGMDRTDPSFAGLLAASVELGDSNHAAGVAADLSWTANRIATWVRHVKPICSSNSFAPYDTVKDLISRSYGRSASDEDVDSLETALLTADIQEAAEQHLVTCIAILSSTEFVLQ